MFAVFTMEFMTGIGIGWLAPMLHRLRDSPEAAFTSENCAWIASLHYITRGLTPLVSIVMINRLGRNMLAITSAFISFIMWVIVFSSLEVYVHYFVRLIFGLGIGLNNAMASIYIGENCSPKVRGIFSGFCLAFFYFGEVMEFLLATFLSYDWLAIVNCIFGFIALLSTALLKEPAHYLIIEGNLAKAEQNYHWLHDLENPTTKQEFEDIKQYVREEKDRSFSWRMLCDREVYKSMRIILLIHFLSYFCGFTAINAFVTIALSGSTGLSSMHLTIFLGVVLLFTVSLSSSLCMDKFNRRTLFLFTSAFITIIHAATAALYIVNGVQRVPHFHWILFILLTTFMSMHGMFIFPVTAVLRGELLPQNVKAIGSSFANVSSSIGGFLAAKIFLPISDSFGMEYNFILFSIVSLIMYLYVYFDLPETRGKTLTNIQRELKGHDKQKMITK